MPRPRRTVRRPGGSKSLKAYKRTQEALFGKKTKKKKNPPTAAQLAKGIKAKWVQIKKVNGRFRVRIKK